MAGFIAPEDTVKSTTATSGFVAPESSVKQSSGFVAPSSSVKQPAGARQQRRGGGGLSESADAFAQSFAPGWFDTYRGVKQIAGLDLEGMAKEEQELLQRMVDNPVAAWSGYLAGLALDPAPWAASLTPLGWLQRIEKVRKARSLWVKYRNMTKARQTAAKIGSGAAAGAAVGSVGYLPEDSINPITGEPMTRLDMAIMGGVGGGVLSGVGKVAADKWGRAPAKEMRFNPDREKGGVYMHQDRGGLGHRAWSAIGKPGPAGAAYGGAAGGVAGYNSPNYQDWGHNFQIGETWGDPQTINSEDHDIWARLANMGAGMAAGALGGRYAFKKKPEWFIKGYGQSDAYKSARGGMTGEAGQIMKKHFEPTLKKLDELNEHDNALMFTARTDMGSPEETLAHLRKLAKPELKNGKTAEELADLMEELHTKIDTFGKELVEISGGGLNARIQAKNAETYLHRIFKNPEKGRLIMKDGGITYVGDEFMARGKVAEVGANKWREMLDDMENAGTAGGVGRTSEDPGFRLTTGEMKALRDEYKEKVGGREFTEAEFQANMAGEIEAAKAAKKETYEWEEWDANPKQLAQEAESAAAVKRWEDKRVRWAERNGGDNAVRYQQELDKQILKAKVKKANEFANPRTKKGQATTAEINATQLTPEEIRAATIKAEKAAGMPPTFRTTAKPAEYEPKVRIRRDWTKAEREEMGEITDIAQAFRATGMILSHDVAAGRFLNKVSKDRKISRPYEEGEAYGVRIDDDGTVVDLDVLVPDNKKKYGSLAKTWVSKETMHDLNSFNKDNLLGSWKRSKAGRVISDLMGIWKGTKTIQNPNVHMNNITSNIMHLDHGITNMGAKKWVWLGKAATVLAKAGFGRNSNMTVRIGGVNMKVSQLMDDAEKAGVFGGHLTDELGQKEIAKLFQNGAVDNTVWNKLTVDGLIGRAAKIADKAWRNAKKKAKPWIWDYPSKIYQWEDNMFRLTVYMAELDKLVNSGISYRLASPMAGRKAKSFFVDYDDPPEVLAWAREAPIPFLSYMYGIVPRLAETAVKNPMKIAKWSAGLYIADEIGWDNSDYTKEERRRLENMQEELYGINGRWGIPLAGPTRLKLGDKWNPFYEQGDEGYLDIGRAYAGGDIFGTVEGDGLGKMDFLPEALQVSGGALGALFFTLANIDQFKGSKIPEGEHIETLLKQFIPNFPIGEIQKLATGWDAEALGSLNLPETWAGNKIQRAMSGNYMPDKDNHTPLTAWASLFGMKFRPFSDQQLQGRIGKKWEKRINEGAGKIRDLSKEMLAGGEDKQYARKFEVLMAKQKRLLRHAVAAVNGQ